ncbi:MAG: hypothetical protein KDB21_05375 [Acidimicrobiales bacterium]|nr:hypothetical protein [Acidimicrobiales bacterium]
MTSSTSGTSHDPAHLDHDRPRRLRWVVAGLGLTSVVPLLAWVCGLGPFHVWFLAVAAPGQVALAGIGVFVRSGRRRPEVRTALVLGVVAGLVGTIGYDLFRVPFVFGGGYRLLSPIESYGVLALDAETSSGWTAVAGWAYHFANGIGFGIAYMAVAARRHWGWGVLWAMVLESGSVFTPFASSYNLWGHPDAIVIAYAAHVPYGLALGLIGMRADRWLGHLRELGRHTIPAVLTVGAALLLVWIGPFTEPSRVEEGRAVAPGPSGVILDEGLSPHWLRTTADGCVTLRNGDDRGYTIDAAVGDPTIVAGATIEVCFEGSGVKRLRTSGEPFDGGFVILDEER